uniref:C2 domain-containing protein n=1 Tax=Glycine max TaxID=3847 RepID=K7KY31_SOYBN
MHVEGKVLIGVKFLPTWSFIGYLRVCFVEPPYFQMTINPDKPLSIAFEQTLVETFAIIDLLGSPGILLGVSLTCDSYDLLLLEFLFVKVQMGVYKFRTKIQRKTLTPKWHEEFKIPIITCESDNVLVIAVRDKDHFYDDILGFVPFYKLCIF